jgi:hypothetical protein
VRHHICLLMRGDATRDSASAPPKKKTAARQDRRQS